jgi:hypothetical protein
VTHPDFHNWILTISQCTSSDEARDCFRSGIRYNPLWSTTKVLTTVDEGGVLDDRVYDLERGHCTINLRGLFHPDRNLLFRKRPLGTGLVVSLRRGNLGHAFEPVGTANLIKRGVFTADDITEMGRRFPALSVGRRSIEADVWISVSNHFIALKKANATVDIESASDLAEQVIIGAVIRRGSYAVQEPGLSPSQSKKIAEANKIIEQYNNDNGESIPLLDIINAGDF